MSSQTCSTCSIYLLIIFMTAGFAGPLMAQGNSELLAPAFVADLNLACAEATNDGKIRIIRSRNGYDVEQIELTDEQQAEMDAAEDETEDEKDGKVRMVAQSYTVTVPYTESVVVDGKTINVTRTRSETRTRMVPISSSRNKQTVTYQVDVPYTEQVVDGSGNITTVTRSRTETRTRIIGKYERLVKKVTPVEATLELDQLRYFSLDGTELTGDQATGKLLERSPVILLVTEKPLDPFYQQLLQPDTIVIVDEERMIDQAIRDATH